MSTVDLVVFADEKVQDLTTSFISAFYAIEDREKVLERAKSLATPIVFLLGSNEVEIIQYGRKETSEKVSYALLEHYFSENRLNYSKKELSTLKNSTEFQPVLLFAIDATKELLTSTFEHILTREKSRLGKASVNEITKVAIHILAACVIEDKLWEQKSSNVLELIKKCQNQFPHYFKGCLSSDKRIEIAKNVYDAIRLNLNFESVSHEVLGYFYEYVILDPKVRNNLGIHWTDEELADKIVNTLPIEKHLA